MINPSATGLSTEDIHLLSKGLGLAPSTNADVFRTLCDVNLFVRKHFMPENPNRSQRTDTNTSVTELNHLDLHTLPLSSSHLEHSAV